MANDAIKGILKRSNRKKKPKVKKDNRLFLKSPSTLLNIGCSGSLSGAFLAGRIVNVVGDSHSGKTVLCLGILAEAANDPLFDDYRLIFDDSENANSFDIENLFGKKLAKRIEPPKKDDEGMHLPSETIEDFQCNLKDALDEDKPFVYILDSFDSIDSDDDAANVEAMREARQRGKSAPGSYGMAKAKRASGLFRNIKGDLAKKNSFLFIISQTRDNLTPGTFQKKTRAGGKALQFYCTHVIWLAMIGKLKKEKNKIKHVIGNNVRALVSKNKITGKVKEVEFSVYPDLGIDDVGSMVDWLAKVGAWGKSGTIINAKELNIKGQRQKVITEIEKQNLEKTVRKIVYRTNKEIENSVKLTDRKKRYK